MFLNRSCIQEDAAFESSGVYNLLKLINDPDFKNKNETEVRLSVPMEPKSIRNIENRRKVDLNRKAKGLRNLILIRIDINSI